MNREILFRGKPIYEETIIGKDFYFGDLCHYANGEATIRQPETGYEMVVVPETIGQFIGVSDKNGKNIFEGDILKTNEAGWIGKVEFKHSAYIITDDKGGYSTYPDFVKCEVIGNTHSNPELLITFF